MSEWTSHPLFGVTLTVGTYALACWVRDRWFKSLNPLLVAATSWRRARRWRRFCGHSAAISLFAAAR
jgi:hypothetical protein